jgi:hypothetical protein
VKGKPWTINQEKKLRQLVEARNSVDVIARELKMSKGAVRKKLGRLGLQVVVVQKSTDSRTTTSNKIVLPKELFSVEEALKMLAGALKKACEPGLDKVEVQRLQVVATLARTYKEILADYLDYRGVEAQLLEMRQKYAELAKKTQGNAAR